MRTYVTLLVLHFLITTAMRSSEASFHHVNIDVFYATG